MKTWIKTSLVTALAAASLCSGTVLAASKDCQCDKGDRGGYIAWRDVTPEQIKERMNKQTEVQLARLELALALKPEQKPAWDDFRKAVAANTEAVVEGMVNMRKAGEPKTVLERLDRMEEMRRQHSIILSDTRKAVESIYGRLEEAQRTVFDAEFGKLMLHPGRGAGVHKGKKRGK